MCPKWNQKFKSKRIQHDYRNKVIETLTKFTSCKCKCRSDGQKCNSDQWWNNNKCWCECKKRHACKKDYACILLHVVANMENYLETIIDNSLIMCDEIIDAETKLNDKETKVIPTNFNEKSITCKIWIAIFYMHFY